MLKVEPLPTASGRYVALGLQKTGSRQKCLAPAPSDFCKALLEIRNRIRAAAMRPFRWCLNMVRAAERLWCSWQDREAWRLPYVSGTVANIVAAELVDYGDGQESWWSAVEQLPHDEEA